VTVPIRNRRRRAGGEGRHRRTQAERRATSEHRLLVATAEVIVERGWANASLAEIGRRAGYSHALVNHLFGSKLALVKRLNDAVDQYYAERSLPALADRTGLDAVTEFVKLYLSLVTGPDALARVHIVLWAEAIAGAPDIRPSRAAWDRRFRTGIATMIANGLADGSVVAGIDPNAASVAVVGMLRGVAMQLLLDPGMTSLAAGQGAVVELVRSLLEPDTP
jgi:AcrR family transcriptional regulator